MATQLNNEIMEKQKIHLQYPLNATSKTILWNAISTPSGLEGWFADGVQSDNKTVTFFWGKTESRSAEIIAVRAYSFIRFRWTDLKNSRDYFEFRMSNSELTNDFTLEIIDLRLKTKWMICVNCGIRKWKPCVGYVAFS